MTLKDLLLDYGMTGLNYVYQSQEYRSRMSLLVDKLIKSGLEQNYCLLPFTALAGEERAINKHEWLLTKQHKWKIGASGAPNEYAFFAPGNHHGYVCEVCGQHLAHDWEPEVNLVAKTCKGRIVCPICGHARSSDYLANFCTYCGTRLEGLEIEK